MLHDLGFLLSCLAMGAILTSIWWNRRKGRSFFTPNWIDPVSGLFLTGSWGADMLSGGSVYRVAGNGIITAFCASWTVFFIYVLVTGKNKKPTNE